MQRTWPTSALRRALPAAALLWAAVAAANPAVEAGRKLFVGSTPLVAHMAGDSVALPRTASRCSNCHAAPGSRAPGPAAGVSATTRFAPGLGSAQLMQAVARRGGPPSRYDVAALCKALRSGVDPAGVVLPAAMPRYQVSDEQCRLLWALLTSDIQ